MAYHYSGLGPPDLGRQAELLPVILEVLRQSNVKAGEKVVLYTDTKKNKEMVDAFYQAATLLGAETAVLYTTPRQVDRTPYSVALHAMQGADIILDLASNMWIYTEALSELLGQGKRILSCVSDIDTCLKMGPDAAIVERVQQGGKLLDAAERIQVRSEAGSDLVLSKRGRRGVYQDGLTPNPGDWDNYPAYQVACAPLEDSATGRLVLEPGDLFVTLKRIVAEQVVLELEDGHIVEINGKAEAEMLRAWFDGWEDPNAYTTSHIGFGCDPRAEVSSSQLMEWETLAGGVMIAFGSNILRFLGGKNQSRAHIDIVMRKADFLLDGELIIQGGNFVHPSLK
jgi:2,5-dihydroxypyridine 5,6-dioxygenase